MTKAEALKKLAEGVSPEEVMDEIFKYYKTYFEDVNKAMIDLQEEHRVLPPQPTPEEERKVWPSLMATNLHDAEKWRYLEEIADKCNLNTVRQIFDEHVKGIEK